VREPVKILGIAGSLRKGSYNRAALRAAKQLAPENSAIEVFELNDIPPYNSDNENPQPKIILEFKNKIRSADAILFVTPEYNYSIPGVLKNAIDWASRPYGDSAWEGKPVGIMGASTGMIGSARAQYHLRQTFVFLDMYALNRPEIMIANATDKFDEDGNLTDSSTRERIKEFMEALINWSVKHKMLQHEKVSEVA
jgi:chromate reductase